MRFLLSVSFILSLTFTVNAQNLKISGIGSYQECTEEFLNGNDFAVFSAQWEDDNSLWDLTQYEILINCAESFFESFKGNTHQFEYLDIKVDESTTLIFNNSEVAAILGIVLQDEFVFYQISGKSLIMFNNKGVTGLRYNFISSSSMYVKSPKKGKVKTASMREWKNFVF
jgi:hypothetical protein